MAMRTLVFEAAYDGHYLHHAGLVAAALTREGAECFLAVNKRAPDSVPYALSVQHLESQLTVLPRIDLGSGGSSISTAHRKLLALLDLLNEIRPDRVYLPTADGLAQMLGLMRTVFPRGRLGRTTFEALLLNGSVAYLGTSQGGKLIKRLSHRLARRGADCFFHLDPMVSEWEERMGMDPALRSRTMPDPVEPSLITDKVEARARLGLPLEGRIVGMVGGLDRRKGADLLMNAFENTELESGDKLLLWGPVAEDVKEELKQLQQDDRIRGRLLLRDEVLDHETFLNAISACDLLVLPYRDVFRSSSILIRAAAAGRPVITTAGGWGESMVNRFGLGWTFDASDRRALPVLIANALDDSTGWNSSELARRFVEYNSCRNYQSHWVRGYIGGIRESAQEPVLWSSLKRSS